MKRHGMDLVSLVFGLIFTLFASLWALWRIGVLDKDSASWLPATALIAIGLLGLGLSITKARSSDVAPAHSDRDDTEVF